MNSSATNIGYEVSATFPVSQERLFRALTDATVLKRIWGVQQITVDARVGGETHATFIAGGQDWSFTITYTEVAPNRLLRWITHFKSFPTKETRVALRFEDAHPGTALTVRMDNFETPEERDANKQAWQQALVTLSEILAA